jgi:antitoxin component YwqK of YwqJK toxin-antitoxin module
MTTASPQPKRRRWWHYLTQFSLRTLLLLTTVVAVGCWWFLQPEAREEELAGKYLKLRRQVRVQTPAPEAAAQATDDEAFVINTGAWRVRDQHGDLLIDGRYADDQPHGKWTIYHVNGHKAAEGSVVSGVRTGLWRTWDEAGTLRSEATYKAVESPSVASPRPLVSPHANSIIPVLGMIDLPLAQFGGGGMLGGGGFPPPPPTWIWQESHIAARHGPAKVWYASGQLRLEGGYQDDLRDGIWTYYDEQGRITAQGAYQAGVREGAWKIRDPAGSQLVTRDFVAGLPRNEHEQLLTSLGNDLTSGSIHRKIAAAERLEQLGQAAVPCLASALDSDDGETQLLALRALGRLRALPEAAANRAAALCDATDARVALRARLCIYLSRPNERARLFAPLVASLEKADDPLTVEALLAMYRTDADRQLPVLALLVERMGRVEIEYQGRRGSAPGYLGQIVSLGWDVVPQLEVIYPQVSSEARWFSVVVLQWLTARSRPPFVASQAGVAEVQWEMPEAGQLLLTRAKVDPDPRVREAAEPRFSGSGLGGGGFF